MQQAAAACSSTLASRSSSFAGARPKATTAAARPAPQAARRLQVVAARGKGNRGTRGTEQMVAPPTPPVDPENEEFVIFVRSKRLPRWMPLSIMKGGTTANMLVKSMGTDFGKDMARKTLVQNVGKALYKEQEQIKEGLRESMPLMKHVQEIEFAFKIRDKTKPKDWYVSKDLIEIPPEEELGGESVVEGVQKFFSGLTGQKE